MSIYCCIPWSSRDSVDQANLEHLEFYVHNFVGHLADGPAMPNEGQPPPPLGATIWKGNSMFTVVNDEHVAN